MFNLREVGKPLRDAFTVGLFTGGLLAGTAILVLAATLSASPAQAHPTDPALARIAIAVEDIARNCK